MQRKRIFFSLRTVQHSCFTSHVSSNALAVTQWLMNQVSLCRCFLKRDCCFFFHDASLKTLADTMSGARNIRCDGYGAARRRCDTRLRSWWPHEQQSIKAAVTTALHPSRDVGPRCASVTTQTTDFFAMNISDTYDEDFAEPAPMTEYVTPAPADTYTELSPVIEYVAPGPAVNYAPRASMTEYVTPEPAIANTAPSPLTDDVAPATPAPVT